MQNFLGASTTQGLSWRIFLGAMTTQGLSMPQPRKDFHARPFLTFAMYDASPQLDFMFVGGFLDLQCTMEQLNFMFVGGFPVRCELHAQLLEVEKSQNCVPSTKRKIGVSSKVRVMIAQLINTEPKLSFHTNKAVVVLSIG